uniref:Casc1 domain-containing protein n=1 Tax=Glossina austeni TaxID=7395 RepID=A0A1A9UY15_GLOAU
MCACLRLTQFYTKQGFKEFPSVLPVIEAVRSVEQQREKQQVLDEWDAYANCDSVPKPHMPADVHAKMAQFRIFEEINLGPVSNRLSFADERSLLSQDIFRKNLTRKELLARTENELGPQCVQTIDTYLEVLRRMEHFLNDDRERNKVTKVALDRIEVVKEELKNEIRDLLNRYTYRVLSTGMYNNTSLDPLTWRHTLVSSNFEMEIFGLKNVPIRWTHMPDLQDLQAIHTNFDHVSEKVKNFEPRSQISTETLSSCMKELSECLQKEFDLQNEIHQEVRAQIVRNYEEYEKKQEEYRVAQNQKKSTKGMNNNKTMPKGIKKPKEPQKINDDEYPDIFKIFLQKESRDHKIFMDNIHNAQVVYLTNGEINLKRFAILGVIYELNFIQAPAVSDFGNCNMVWHSNNKNLVVDKDARIPRYSTKASPSLNQSVLDVRGSDGNNLNPNLEGLSETIDAENPLFVLKVEPLRFLSLLNNFSPTPPSAPTTFYQLINALKLIKQMYQQSYRNILDLPDFKAKFDLAKKLSKRPEMQKVSVKPLRSAISTSHLKTTSKHSVIRGFTISFNRPMAHKRESSPESIDHGSEPIKYEHWTTRYIRSSRYIENERKIIIETDRLEYTQLADNALSKLEVHITPEQATSSRRIATGLQSYLAQCGRT